MEREEKEIDVELELREVITSITAAKHMFENTILNVDEMHDVAQTLLTGLRQRLDAVVDDVGAGALKLKVTQKMCDELGADNEAYARRCTILALTLERARANEKKKGKHPRIQDLLNEATLEVDSQEGGDPEGEVPQIS